MTFKEKYRQEYKDLSYLSIFMTGGLICFFCFGTTFLILEGPFLGGHKVEYILFPASIILIWAALKVARYTYKCRVSQLHIGTVSSKDRLEQLKTVVFLHHGITGIPAITSVICIMLFGTFIYFIIVAISVREMISKYPNEERVTEAISILNFRNL